MRVHLLKGGVSKNLWTHSKKILWTFSKFKEFRQKIAQVCLNGTSGSWVDGGKMSRVSIKVHGEAIMMDITLFQSSPLWTQSNIFSSMSLSFSSEKLAETFFPGVIY